MSLRLRGNYFRFWLIFLPQNASNRSKKRREEVSICARARARARARAGPSRNDEGNVFDTIVGNGCRQHNLKVRRTCFRNFALPEEGKNHGRQLSHMHLHLEQPGNLNRFLNFLSQSFVRRRLSCNRGRTSLKFGEARIREILD